MDLGIAGRRAIVCASSKGLGKACATSLAREGVHVVINGRTPEPLAEAAEELRALGGGEVTPVLGDITTPEGRAALQAACPEADILINNNAGPPPGHYHDWTPEVWRSAIEGNMLAAIYLIQSVVDGMRERKFGRIINITSAMVKAPRPPLGLSSTARAGLTAFCKGLSREVAKDNVTINNLLPERIDTGRQVQMAKRNMKAEGITFEEARARIADSISAKRFGLPIEFGDTCAYFCSVQASFISGQNIQIDGGSYPGLV